MLKKTLTLVFAVLMLVVIAHTQDLIFNPRTQNVDYIIYSRTVASGNVLYHDGTVWQVLTTGANGQVLTLAAGIPSWAALAGTDNKVGVDATATVGYLGAAYNDGVFRIVLNELTYADGGDFITLGLADHNTARTALGLAIGSDVQAYAANLTTYAGIAPSSNVQTLLGAANYGAFKTSLSLGNVEDTALSTWAGTNNITTLGTIGTGTWNADTIPVNKGGTNISSYTVGDLIYASTTGIFSRLADVAVGSYLSSGGVGVAPAWATLNQAAVAGLTTGSSPVFVTTKLSGLTDGYVPYHVADATGLANSVIFIDGIGVGIGTATIPHGGVGWAKFAIDGTNASSAGPHIQFTTTDNYPLMQILPYSHDDMSIRFDSYWDGANKSSDAGSNYAIFKVSNLFRILYDSGVAKGAQIAWNDGIVLNTSGNVGIGAAPTANMAGLSIELGLLTLKERATPTADADYGKIYPKADGNLYFQDSAVGAEHAIGADYAGVSVHLNAVATDIALVEAWEKFLFFDANSPEYISDGDHTSNDITIGSTGVYSIEFSADGNAAGVNKSYEFSVFELSPTATTITAATAADPVVITAAGHGFTGGERVAIKAMTAGGMVEVNDRIFTVADVVGATFELTDNGGASPANDIDGTGFAAYTTGGTVQLATELDVFSHRKFAVNGDTGSFSGGNHCTLMATNTLEIYIKGETDNTNFTIDCIAMRIRRIN